MSDELIREIGLVLLMPNGAEVLFRLAVLWEDNDVPPEDVYMLPSRPVDGEVPVSLPEIMRDVYFVTWLDNDYNEENQGIKTMLSEKDAFWNKYIIALKKLVEVSYYNYQSIVDDRDCDEEEVLFRRKGRRYMSFIEDLGEPYNIRYKIIHVLSQLHSQARIRNHFGGFTGIVCNAETFIKFWNESLQKLQELQLAIQKEDVEDLKSAFGRILKSEVFEERFDKRYMGEDGCFMKTNVVTADANEDVLCFSGLKDFDGNDYLSRAVKMIVDSGYFHNAYLVKVRDGIRYYLSDSKYITLGEAKAFGGHLEARMFSCCERKTFADYDWSKCVSYKMIVKYEPCGMCSIPVKKHRAKYKPNELVWGKKWDFPLKDMDKYDAIAKEIYDANNPAKL